MRIVYNYLYNENLFCDYIKSAWIYYSDNNLLICNICFEDHNENTLISDPIDYSLAKYLLKELCFNDYLDLSMYIFHNEEDN